MSAPPARGGRSRIGANNLDTTAGSFHLSPQQEDLWAREPSGPSGRVQGSLRLDGRLDVARVQGALARAVERHESLRTSFARQDGLRFPLQVVGTSAVVPVTVLEAGDRDGPAAVEARSAEREAQFDFAQGPLVRALFITDGATAHELTLTVSALCADPASLALLAAECVADLADTGMVVDDPLQYADFAAWQRELLDSDDDEARSANEQLKDLVDVSYPQLPFARTGERQATDAIDVAAGPELSRAIAAAAQRYGVSAESFVQAAWLGLLHRFTGQGEVAVAYLSGQRRHPDLEGAIGAFSRPVPVRVATGVRVSFAELLHGTDRARDAALVLQDYAPIAAGAPPSCGFVGVQGVTVEGAGLRAALTSVRVTSRFGLWLTCLERDGELDLSVGFDPASHTRAAAGRLAEALCRVLGAAAADPGITLGALPVLAEAERDQLLHGFAGPQVEFEPVTVTALIAARAASAPERDAVLDAAGSVTYAELQRRAAQLAHRLIEAGVTPGARVALCTEGADTVIALLGILHAGAAYVPLHPDHPQARLADQLTTAQVTAIVTQNDLRERLPHFAGPIVCLDRDRAELDRQPASPPEVQVGPDSLAYVIYTSGSTGTPKGVGVTHANLVNYIGYLIRRLGADTTPLHFGMVTSIATDLGNTSLFGALGSGGTLVMAGAEVAGDPGALAALSQHAGIDVLKITPSHLGALLAAGDGRVLPRRWLILGGERAPWDLIAAVRELGSPQIINHYGPTETTIGSCTYAVGEDPGPFAPASVPIGAPIANTRVYVLDDARELVPLGVPGRLYIAGAGVAAGYLGQPELTAERFIADPYRAGERMYDTGDVARWLPDGALEFLGRADDQVKIRGFRVEPGEIETVLRSHPEVSEAVVVAHASSAGELRLAAYCGAPSAPSPEELRRHLAQRLPEYMVPPALAVLERLPRTPSGKIDRLALPDPDALSVEEGDYVAPSTPMQEAVARIWAEVLGLARVGVQDDFFSLGGHSLLATQVVAQVRSDFAVDLPLHSLFTYPTVASLTSEIVGMMGAADDDETAQLMAELDGMSDEEAERLLRGDSPSQV
jgi:amino acid adenylation domain-containing protein